MFDTGVLFIWQMYTTKTKSLEITLILIKDIRVQRQGCKIDFVIISRKVITVRRLYRWIDVK